MKKKLIYIIIFVFILMSIDLFSAWRKVQNLPADYRNTTYLDIFFLKSNPNYGWACGYDGKTLRTTDGGKTWLGSRLFDKTGFAISAQLESITFVSEKVGFVSGPRLDGWGYGLIFKSTNGGESWFDVTPRNVEDIWGNYFIDENHGVAIGGGCDSYQYFWHTTDGGANWAATIYSQNGSKMSDALIFDKDGLAYAIGSGWLWISQDGGASWKPLYSTGSVDWHEELTRVGDSFLIPYSEGCYGNTITNVGGAKFSIDGGKTWRRHNTGVPMFGTFLLDEHRGYAVGFNTTVIYTSDAGLTWTNQNCGILPGDDLDDIWFINDTTAWAAGNGIYEFFIPYAMPPKITSSSGDKNFKLCEGDTIILTASDGFDTYLWSNGERTQQITVSGAGTYSVLGIVDSICYNGLSDSISVSFYDKYEPKFKLSNANMPCEGDTITIELEGEFLDYEWQNGSRAKNISITENTEVTVLLIDTNGCKFTATKMINFVPNPKPKIVSNGRVDFCTGDSVVLSTTEMYSEFNWYDENSGNLISKNREISIKSSGKYYVIVKNSSGCEGISEPIEINIIEDKNALSFVLDNKDYFDLDSVNFTRINCKELTIYNSGDNDIILDDLYFLKNITFSSPQSQFPLRIEAHSDLGVKVCFSPNKLGLDDDTLFISDKCSDHFLRLVAYGMTEEFNDITRCEVPLTMEITDFNNNSFLFGVGKFYPNPANSSINIDFSAQISDANLINQNIDLRVMNSIGQLKEADFSIVSTPIADHLVDGIITLNTNDLTAGIYFVTINIYGKILTEKFVVVK